MLSVLLLGLEPISAQEKVVERSASRAPKWIGITLSDYIITSGEGKTLDAAKDKCLNDIRQAIINGVSVNICSEEQSFTEQRMHNNEEDITSGYSSQVKTIAARMPFIANISLSDAELYWERRMDKKSKESHYIAHAKYPFTAVQRMELVVAFKKQDKAQYDKYLALKDHLSKFTSIEEIGRVITDLKPLENYFFDSRRKDEVIALMRNYQKMYQAIQIVPYENDLGRHVFYFLLEGRIVETAVAPVIKKQYATNVVVRPIEGGCYEVTYDYDQCLDDDDNSIELIYRIGGGHALKHKFTFDVSQGKTAVLPYGEIELSQAKDMGDELPLVNGMMTLRSKYDEPFEVEELVFSVSGLRDNVECAPEVKIEGKGQHTLRFTATMDTAWKKADAKMASGYIKVRNLKTRKTTEVRFTLPCKAK